MKPWGGGGFVHVWALLASTLLTVLHTPLGIGRILLTCRAARLDFCWNCARFYRFISGKFVISRGSPMQRSPHPVGIMRHVHRYSLRHAILVARLGRVRIHGVVVGIKRGHLGSKPASHVDGLEMTVLI